MAEKQDKEKKATTRRTKAAKTTTRATPTRARAAAAAPARARRAPARKAAAAVLAPVAPAVWRKSRRRTLVGAVVADKTPNTVIVEVTRLRRHPLYKKVIRVRKRMPTHDPNEEAKLGDVVRIEESRPFSATKRFRIAEVLSRAAEAREAAPQVAAVEAALEEAAGVTEVLVRKPVEAVTAEEESE